jgi:phosphoglycerate dehydrogenase-like enzyme
MEAERTGGCMNVLINQKMNSLWEENLICLRKELPAHSYFGKEDSGFPDISEVDVIIGGKPDKKMVGEALNLKLIIAPMAGINHLPLEDVSRRNIRVANSHGNAPDVAERALAMILGWYGKIIDYHQDLKEGQWHGFWVNKGLDDTWESIRGSSCTILGAGEIGKELAKLLAPFEVDCIGYRRKSSAAIPPGFSRIVSDLDEAIGCSDIVVVALPATAETTGLIDASRLSKMKGKLLVNVGRGSIVDENALADALENGTLGGAALDCWYNYPKGGTVGAPSIDTIYKHPRVLLSPHVAGFTAQAAKRNIDQAFENLRRFLTDGSLLFEADPSGGY